MAEVDVKHPDGMVHAAGQVTWVIVEHSGCVVHPDHDQKVGQLAGMVVEHHVGVIHPAHHQGFLMKA